MSINPNQLKRISVIVFFSVMLYSQLGYYIGGKVIQLVLKEQAGERVLQHAPDSNLVVIPLAGNEKNIVWEEPDREFSYRGQMYDVVRIRTVNHQLVYYCIDDKHEDELIDKLNDITKSNHQPADKNTCTPGVKLVYNPVIVRPACLCPQCIATTTSCIDDNDALQQPFTSIVVPPPRG